MKLRISADQTKIKAMAVLRAFGPNFTVDSSVWGIVKFQQLGPGGPVQINGTIHGLSPGKHGLAISELGDLTKGCNADTDHYNPIDKGHGGILSSTRHCGDLGNIIAGPNGTATFGYKVHLLLRIVGKFGVIGRKLLVGANEDDSGRCSLTDCSKNDTAMENTQIDGNIGPYVACGIIGIIGEYSILGSSSNSIDPNHWLMMVVLLITMKLQYNN